MEDAVSPFLGVFLHGIGGLAAASFYLPYQRVRGWPWENAWLLGGVFSWIIAPAVAAALLAPHAWDVLRQAPPKALFWTWAFGFLWGIGGVTFGLSMRYLGIALGYAVALGMCAFFGTLLPPIFSGEIDNVISSSSGQTILTGLLVCLAGMAMSGKAGLNKERELSDEQKSAAVPEFHFSLGIVVALFAGVMSACMAFGFAAGKPIADLATASGLPPLWQNLPVLIVVLFGGFCLNLLWCGCLILARGDLGVYWGQPAQVADGEDTDADPLPFNWQVNCLWCALAGITWYLQFFFYGMGTTKMGAYEFSSWTLHMASIIVFSTLWGVALHEWKGTSRATHFWIAAGLATLILSTLIVGWGNAQAAGADDGLADRESEIYMATDHAFGIGMIVRPMTAVNILTLEAQTCLP